MEVYPRWMYYINKTLFNFNRKFMVAAAYSRVPATGDGKAATSTVLLHAAVSLKSYAWRRIFLSALAHFFESQQAPSNTTLRFAYDECYLAQIQSILKMALLSPSLHPGIYSHHLFSYIANSSNRFTRRPTNILLTLHRHSKAVLYGYKTIYYY